MKSLLAKVANAQPAHRFLVASLLAFASFLPSSAMAVADIAGPTAIRFIVTNDAQPSASLRSWSKDETRQAAAEAEAVIRQAAARVQAALAGNDAAFFMGAGQQYMRQEWPLFTAQEVAYVFGLQADDLKNPWIPSYSTCERAGKALGDWYHFYRSNLHNGHTLNDLKAASAAKQEELELWTNLAACKKSL